MSRSIQPGDLDRVAEDLGAPPLIRTTLAAPPPPAAVDRLAFYRGRLHDVRFFQTLTFWTGLFFCTIGTLAACVVEDRAREMAEILHRPPEVSPLPSSTATFFFGISLCVISQLMAINLAIRETHLEQAERPPRNS